MAKIVIELTNRCNLKCHHCFSGRHGGKDDLPMSVLENIWRNARDHGFDFLAFTGGDPTLHKNFAEIIQQTADNGYNFGLNTNGINFGQIYPTLVEQADRFQIVTFSMDGASEETHDKLRGKNAYRRLMQAISICVFEQIPFALNMVIAAHNRHEVEKAVQTAINSGARGVRFCHLMPAPLTTDMDLDLSPWDRKLVEAEIAQMRHRYPIAVEMAPGDHTTDPFPCAPLHLEEVNVDCHGNLTTCCHLSGHGPGTGEGDIIGNLQSSDFGAALTALKQENERFHAAKRAHLASGTLTDTDFFACWYCTNYYRKVDWLRSHQGHPWVPHIWENKDTAVPQPKPTKSQPIVLENM